MKIERVQRTGYTMVYSVFEAGVDFDPSDDLHALKCLSGYELHKGYGVWKIGATYAKHLKPVFYYVISPSKAVALNKFLTIFPWLSVVMHIEELGEEDAGRVLSCPAKYIVV